MANYGFIYMQDMTVAVALDVITTAARALFQDRVRVRACDAQSNLLLVEIPCVNPTSRKEAIRMWLAFGEPAGFSVEINPSWEERPCLAFRHGMHPPWLRWVQGCVEEQVSDLLGVAVVYDATDEAKGPGRRWYRNAATYRGHCEARVGAIDAEYERLFAFAVTPHPFLDGAKGV